LWRDIRISGDRKKSASTTIAMLALRRFAFAKRRETPRNTRNIDMLKIAKMKRNEKHSKLTRI